MKLLNYPSQEKSLFLHKSIAIGKPSPPLAKSNPSTNINHNNQIEKSTSVHLKPKFVENKNT